VLGTRTGRPSDAPIPLCPCETPAFTIPCSGSIAGGNGSRLFVALAMGMVQMRLGGSGRTQINQMVSRQNGRQRVIATIPLLGSSLRVSNYRRRASGFLTSAALRGPSIFKMMDVSRHRSVETFEAISATPNYSATMPARGCRRTLGPTKSAN
jgi:hypothetical protein